MTINISLAMALWITKTFNSSSKDLEKLCKAEDLQSSITWLENMVSSKQDPTFMPVSSDTTFLIKNYGKGLPLVIFYIDPQNLKLSGHLVIPPLETLLSNQPPTWLDT
jgi:hypothetical protein